jgi:hypothetical protein
MGTKTMSILQFKFISTFNQTTITPANAVHNHL